MDTKFPELLSAKYKDSFAYKTVKDRMPAILCKVADHMHRLRDEIMQKHGQGGVDDLKQLAGEMSRLRSELQTDKPVVHLRDTHPDTLVWNAMLDKLTQDNAGTPPSWFTSSWLYVECYMYRRIQEAVNNSKLLKDLDPFGVQKEQALFGSMPGIIVLMMHTLRVQGCLEQESVTDFKYLVLQYIQISLWGNKCDLSISGGEENLQEGSIIDQLEGLKSNILIDDSEDFWNILTRARSSAAHVRVDFVLDNAGFELITDFCLADILMYSGLVDTIHFHGKDIPWFVSDTTKHDFDWTLQTILASNSMYMSRLGTKWKEYIKTGKWVFKTHNFWTLYYGYAEMRSRALDLYTDLADASMLIIKGDLNYRKIASDRNWPTTTQFVAALEGFHPAPLCCLRSLKSDLVVGLKPGEADTASVKDPNWMINGNWAIISVCDRRDAL